jgi:superfamily II DNA or RNA helicase
MEIHMSLTIEYSKFYFNNTYDAIIGLSATVDRETSYPLEDGTVITKGQILDQIAPVFYKYSVGQGQKDGTSRKLNIHVIHHSLDAVAKTVTAGTKAKPFLTTEYAAYNYWDNEFKKSLFLPASIKEFKLRNCAAARAKVLYNMESKVIAVQKLLPALKGKSIVFGNSLDMLLKITPNVVCGKNTDKKNTQIRQHFDSGFIKLIGSFKVLKQGANLDGLDNVIITSYFSKSLDFIQMIGRLRISGTKDGNVFIFLTKGTTEQKWFEKIFADVPELTLTYHQNIDEVINQISK